MTVHPKIAESFLHIFNAYCKFPKQMASSYRQELNAAARERGNSESRQNCIQQGQEPDKPI